MRMLFRFTVAGVLTCSTPTRAENKVDRGAARKQLEIGYQLKQAGQCDRAIPYFEESNRLNRHPKALLNLADCESQTGRLLSSERHTVEARDLAQTMAMAEFVSFAAKQLEALHERIPQVVLRPAPGAPADMIVERDAVAIEPSLLSKEMAFDPGHYSITVRGGGFERVYTVDIAEGDRKTIDLDPRDGTKIASLQAALTKAPETTGESNWENAAPGARANSQAEAKSDGWFADMPIQRKIAIGAGGAGVIGLGVSLVLAQSAHSSWKDAAARCDHGFCSDAADVDRAASARRMGDFATAMMAIGVAGVAAGAVLWFTAPASNGVGVAVTPMWGRSQGGVLLRGNY
jgi:hypothetical protein